MTEAFLFLTWVITVCTGLLLAAVLGAVMDKVFALIRRKRGER